MSVARTFCREMAKPTLTEVNESFPKNLRL